jgi:hypothetical protein
MKWLGILILALSGTAINHFGITAKTFFYVIIGLSLIVGSWYLEKR